MAENRNDPFEPLTDEEGNHVFDESYFRAWARKIALDVRTHVPAEVVSYDPAKGTVTCKVCHLMVVKVRDGKPPANAVATEGEGADMIATLPAFELRDIRVAWPRTKKGSITFPLEAGDTGELHVSDRVTARWYKEGKPVDPVLGLLHNLQSSHFYPGIAPDATPAPPYDATKAVLHCDGGVKLDKDADKPIALEPPLKTFLQQLLTAIGAATAPPGGGAITFAAPSLPNFASEKVEAK